jgi:hypothetical protein
MHKTTNGMRWGNFCIESDCGVQSSRRGTTAAKSLGIQYKGEIRVVYAPKGEVIFRERADG